jgi:hypothetical protein
VSPQGAERTGLPTRPHERRLSKIRAHGSTVRVRKTGQISTAAPRRRTIAGTLMSLIQKVQTILFNHLDVPRRRARRPRRGASPRHGVRRVRAYTGWSDTIVACDHIATISSVIELTGPATAAASRAFPPCITR